MRDRKITFEEFPEDKLAEVKGLAAECDDLLPDWLAELTIRYRALINDNGTIAEIGTDPEYRHGCLTIYLGFFDPTRDREDRLRSLAHEFLHVTVEQIASCANRILDSGWKDDGPFKTFGRDQIRKEVESTVTDLARAFTRVRKKCPAS